MAGEAITPELGLSPPIASSSLLNDSIGAIQSSLKSDDKKRGKWTRSERIGSLTLEEAQRIAGQWTCRSEDLTLYRWCDIRDDWRKYEWMSPNDVVLRGIICLLCYEALPQPAFHSHMRAEHPSEDNDVAEITKRLSEVRLSRFQTLGVVSKEDIRHEFADIPFLLLETFLVDCGFIVQELKNLEPIEAISKSRRFKLSRPQDSQIDEEIYAEDDIKGISSQDAQDIAEILCSNGGCSKSVFFSSSFTASTATGVRRHYHRVYCPVCQVVVADVKLRQHMKCLFHVTLSSVEENSYEIIRRLTDVRLWKFFAANPVPSWKIADLCSGNNDVINKLSDFLIHRGFVINPFANECAGSWPPKFTRNVEETTSVESNQRANVGLSSFIEDRDMDDASDDSASTCSSYSSASSSASGSSTDSCMTFPVMNCIRHDLKIVEVLQQLKQKLCTDDGALDQHEFIFVLGYAMYSLVVSNGCKLTVLSNLREGDVTRTMNVKDSGLRMLHFSSKSTCTSGRKSNFLVLDEQVQQAMELFILAKHRRACVLRCSSATHPENLFFVSYSLKGLRNNDVDYPISKFLGMCGIKWKFRSTYLIDAALDMVAKDFKNSTGEQALNYYRKLHERCETVSRSECPSNNHVVESMCVVIGCKTRKDKGSIMGPRKGYCKNSVLLKQRQRLKFNPYTNRSVKLINKVSREIASETSSAEMQDEKTEQQPYFATDLADDMKELPPFQYSPNLEDGDTHDYTHIDNL